MQHEMEAEEVQLDDDGDGFPWQIVVFALPCLLLILFILKKKTKGNGT